MEGDFSKIYEVQFSCGYAHERLLNLYVAVLVRTELLDVALWMRSLENPPLNTADAPRQSGHDFVSWATSEKYAEEVQHYSKIKAQFVRSTHELSSSEVDDFVNRFINGGIIRQGEKVLRNKRKFLPKVGRLAIEFSPRVVKRFAKRCLPTK